MKGYINGTDFWELPAMKYYAPPSSWSAEKRKENALNKIFSGEWYGARKVDGVFFKFIKDDDGNMYLIGRSKSVNGDYLNKIDWVPHLHDFFNELPNGTCFLGELYLPRNEQAKTTTSIMNCLCDKAISRQQKEEDKLHYYIFDILAFEGESFLQTKAEDRLTDQLNLCWRAYGEHYHEWAEYKSGQELWELLQTLLADGYEGVVIINGDSLYQPGKRSNSVSLKIKKELQDTIDCVVIGANPPTREYTGKEIETWSYWFSEISNTRILAEDFLKENHHTLYEAYVNGAAFTPVTKNWFFGWAGSLRLGLYKGDKLVEVGNLSGVTDEIKQNWKDYVGQVVEVTAMEIMDTGGLRHPKFCRWRDDVDAADCKYERVFG